MTTDTLIEITLNESDLPAPTPEVEQERRVAIFDLLEENFFALEDARAEPGPYRLNVGVADGRLVFDVTTEAQAPAAAFHLSLSPFRQVIRDYFQICESYFEAVKRLPAAQIEPSTWDGAAFTTRARVLQERLDGKIQTDKATARRLFTLVCVLHFKGLRAHRGRRSKLGSVLLQLQLHPLTHGRRDHKKAIGYKALCVQSAGVRHELEIDGFAISVCQEIGVELNRHRARSFDEMEEWGDDISAFELVVALSPAAQRAALEYTRVFALEVEYWPILDPTELGASREEKLAAYRQARDQILERVKQRFGVE